MLCSLLCIYAISCWHKAQTPKNVHPKAQTGQKNLCRNRQTSRTIRVKVDAGCRFKSAQWRILWLQRLIANWVTTSSPSAFSTRPEFTKYLEFIDSWMLYIDIGSWVIISRIPALATRPEFTKHLLTFKHDIMLESLVILSSHRQFQTKLCCSNMFGNWVMISSPSALSTNPEFPRLYCSHIIMLGSCVMIPSPSELSKKEY